MFGGVFVNYALGAGASNQNAPLDLIGKKTFPLKGFLAIGLRDSAGADPRILFRHKTSSTDTILNGSNSKLRTQNGEHHCKIFVTPDSKFVLGFKAYMPSVGTKRSLCAFLDGGEYQIELTYNADDKISVYCGPAQSGGTLLGTTASAIPVLTTERRIEIEVVIHPSNGRVVIDVDGSNVLSLTSQNTRYTSKNRITGFALGGGTFAGTSTIYLETRDFYWGGANKGFLGNWSVAFSSPTANGALNEWPIPGSNNYASVDDATVFDDNSTYINNSGTDQPLTELYETGDLAVGDNMIAAQVMAYARFTTGGWYPWAFFGAMRTGGTTQFSPGYTLPQYPTDSADGFYAALGDGSNFFSKDAQNKRLTEAIFNAAQFGFKATNG